MMVPPAPVYWRRRRVSAGDSLTFCRLSKLFVAAAFPRQKVNCPLRLVSEAGRI